jgi:hypothetical protein
MHVQPAGLAPYRRHRRPNSEAAVAGGFAQIGVDPAGYLSWVETLLKVLVSWVPRPLTTAMIATEMPAAIRPYSIAVAPESFFKNATNFDM